MSDLKPVESVLIIGAGGHARSVIDVVEAESKYNIVGLLDSVREVGEEVFGYAVAGREQDLPELAQRFTCSKIIIAVGDNYQRQAIMGRLAAMLPTLALATTVHPSALVSRRAVLGPGCVVMAGAIINAGSEIGDGCIVNTGASIDHDCRLGDYSSIAPGAILGGEVTVSERSAVLLGALVSHRTTIGADSVIGAGSFVIKDIPAHVVAYGTPCQVMRSRPPGDTYL